MTGIINGEGPVLEEAMTRHGLVCKSCAPENGTNQVLDGRAGGGRCQKSIPPVTAQTAPREG